MPKHHTTCDAMKSWPKRLRRLKHAVLIPVLIGSFTGCQSAGGLSQSPKTKYLDVFEICISVDNDDCPLRDSLINGSGLTVPDPGRGPVTVEWQTYRKLTPEERRMTSDERHKTAPSRVVDHKEVIPTIRRVRYWDEKQIAIQAKKDGYSPDDPKFRAWAKTQFSRGISYLTLLYLPGGRVVAEATDTPGTLCSAPSTEYCPNEGTEE